MFKNNLRQTTTVLLSEKKCVFKNKESIIVLTEQNTNYKIKTSITTDEKKHYFIALNDKTNSSVTKNNEIVFKKNYAHSDNCKTNKLTNLYKITWYFIKFRYYGKGLKIKKSNVKNQILFNLGKSHLSKFLFKNNKVTVSRTKKNTFTIISNVCYRITNRTMAQIKNFNKYTKRGVRLNRQPIIRRFGKVSQVLKKR